MKQLDFHDKGAKESSVNWKGGKIEAKEPPMLSKPKVLTVHLDWKGNVQFVTIQTS